MKLQKGDINIVSCEFVKSVLHNNIMKARFAQSLNTVANDKHSDYNEVETHNYI